MPVLALALSAAAAAAAGTHAPVPQLKDEAAAKETLAALLSDEKAHDREVRAMTELLVSYTGERNPELREEMLKSFMGMLERASALCDREMTRINAVNFGAITHAFAGSGDKRAFGSAAVLLTPLEREHSRLCQADERLAKEFTNAHDAHAARDKEARAQADARTRRRAAAAGAVAAGAALLAVVRALRNRRPRPALPARSPAPVSAPPPDLGDYTVGRLIGRGGLGETFEGYDRTLQRKVALKFLKPELLAAPEDAERIAAGARAAAAVRHPNLVTLHALARLADRPTLVFELVEGPSLEAVLAKDGALPWPKAASVAAAAAEALEAAHAAGLVHGDLRPADILLDRSGAAKVKGLGFASPARSSLSRTGTSATPFVLDYMAPEREIGAPDAASDAWSLAAVVYRALTGRPPFAGPDALADKRSARFPLPSTLAKGLPSGADAVFRRAFAADPAARFPTPRAFASALR